jgi:GNAT superfamily N-acetyltransferase
MTNVSRRLHDVTVGEQPIARIGSLAQVPVAFVVASRLEVREGSGRPERFTLVERKVDRPYLKDYDAGESGAPGHWTSRFDLTHWGLIAATVEGRWVGGAAIATGNRAIEMPEGRSDLAVLWDIRVAPEFRRTGVGRTIFLAVEAWSRSRGFAELKVETQDINVPACRFYERQGCELRRIDRRAYPGLDEVQLLWYRSLDGRFGPSRRESGNDRP